MAPPTELEIREKHTQAELMFRKAMAMEQASKACFADGRKEMGALYSWNADQTITAALHLDAQATELGVEAGLTYEGNDNGTFYLVSG